MKLKLTTTYEEVDHHWLKWWIENNAKNYGMNTNMPLFPFVMKSKDPTSEVTATTKIELLEEEPN